jgi:hypothetical protein
MALIVLYQGTTSVVPPLVQNDEGFSPCKTQGPNVSARDLENRPIYCGSPRIPTGQGVLWHN